MLKLAASLLVFSAIFSTFSLKGAQPSTQMAQPVPQQNTTQLTAQSPEVIAAKKAADNWLQFVDQGNYAGSWEAGSLTLKLTIPRDEWAKILTAIRKPFGRVVSRQLIDMRPAPNPKNLPAGDYMVLLFDTTFGNGAKANEILTLQENNGAWRVLTYQAAESE